MDTTSYLVQDKNTAKDTTCTNRCNNTAKRHTSYRFMFEQWLLEEHNSTEKDDTTKTSSIYTMLERVCKNTETMGTISAPKHNREISRLCYVKRDDTNE
eukprot:5376540-Ditylum_brightwellii.AAC.2